ncbi:hypothetical protein CHELA20_52730 [Hyphomicrobiales bacterium]|nr:hypothetical protein CHELA41_22195 [Hyphomicrobiales bacterium]CAH1682748.1 hypothetical protein CHELA20_52730 [Hyphomicrobiales bacterium]
MQGGEPPLRLALGRGLPIETMYGHRETAPVRKIGQILDSQQRILEMGRDDGQVFAVEGNKLDLVHFGPHAPMKTPKIDALMVCYLPVGADATDAAAPASMKHSPASSVDRHKTQTARVVPSVPLQ